MKIITDGAEHHFLTFLEKIKTNPSGWIACSFGFSKKLTHETLVARRAHIKADLAALSSEAEAFIASFQDAASKLPGAILYKFSDHDVVLLCCPVTEIEQKTVRATIDSFSNSYPKDFCELGFLTKELDRYQKLAMHKLLNQKKILAYETLSNESMIESLPLRRKNRDEPIVLVVEDDRFTASYISGFLKEFDVVVARNGEEAILKYIEYAPDAMFLDIHLPGINGHQTLQAIKSIDKESFVVMLSVDTAKSSILKASEYGAASYLKKPFSRERVLNTLRLSPFIRNSRGILPIFSGDRV
jgi:CheY-like chemotaxis protein